MRSQWIAKGLSMKILNNNLKERSWLFAQNPSQLFSFKASMLKKSDWLFTFIYQIDQPVNRATEAIPMLSHRNADVTGSH